MTMKMCLTILGLALKGAVDAKRRTKLSLSESKKNISRLELTITQILHPTKRNSRMVNLNQSKALVMTFLKLAVFHKLISKVISSVDLEEDFHLKTFKELILKLKLVLLVPLHVLQVQVKRTQFAIPLINMILHALLQWFHFQKLEKSIIQPTLLLLIHMNQTLNSRFQKILTVYP